MSNGSADGHMQEIVAEVDHEITSAQPLLLELPGSNNAPSPASNMADEYSIYVTV